jgi:hypothetical protein
MTPAEKAGFVIGKQYRVKEQPDVWPAVGTVLTFLRDDGTFCPQFTCAKTINSHGSVFVTLTDLEPVPEAVVGEYSVSVMVRNGITSFAVTRELSKQEIAAVFALLNK